MTPEEQQEAIRDIKRHLIAQDNTWEKRRKEDDRREERSSQQRDELLHRVDEHGKRTTVLETKHEAFFGAQGAYQHIVAKSEENGKKLDKLFWMLFMLAIGMMTTLLKGILHL